MEIQKNFVQTTHADDKPDSAEPRTNCVLCSSCIEAHSYVFPPDRHILFEAMQRRTKVLFPKLVTENENNGSGGLHKINDFVNQPVIVRVETNVAEDTAIS